MYIHHDYPHHPLDKSQAPEPSLREKTVSRITILSSICNHEPPKPKGSHKVFFVRGFLPKRVAGTPRLPALCGFRVRSTVAAIPSFGAIEVQTCRGLPENMGDGWIEVHVKRSPGSVQNCKPTFVCVCVFLICGLDSEFWNAPQKQTVLLKPFGELAAFFVSHVILPILPWFCFVLTASTEHQEPHWQRKDMSTNS